MHSGAALTALLHFADDGQRPNERRDPTDERPAETRVEHRNGILVMMTANDRDDGRQEVTAKTRNDEK